MASPTNHILDPPVVASADSKDTAGRTAFSADTSTDTTDLTGCPADTTTSITTASDLGSDCDKSGAPATATAVTDAATAATTSTTSATLTALGSQLSPCRHHVPLPAGRAADAAIERVVEGAEARARLAPTAVPGRAGILSSLPRALAPGPDSVSGLPGHGAGHVLDNDSVPDTPATDDIELATYGAVVEMHGDDLSSARYSAFVATSVSRPYMFRRRSRPGVDDWDTLMEERRIADGAYVKLPFGPPQVGSASVPTLVSPTSILPFRDVNMPVWQTCAGLADLHEARVDDDNDSMIGCADEECAQAAPQ